MENIYNMLCTIFMVFGTTIYSDIYTYDVF